MYAHTKKVVIQVLSVIGLWCAVGELLIFIFMGVNSEAMLGLLLGGILAAGAFVHMGFSLENSLDTMDEEAAKKSTIRSYIIRTAVIVAVLTAAVISGKFNILFIIIGMFALKFGAYTQPLVDKIYSKIFAGHN